MSKEKRPARLDLEELKEIWREKGVSGFAEILKSAQDFTPVIAEGKVIGYWVGPEVSREIMQFAPELFSTDDRT